MGKKKAKTGARMGRPPVPAKRRKSVNLCLRVTPGEQKRLLAEAKRRGCTVTDLLLEPWRKTERG